MTVVQGSAGLEACANEGSPCSGIGQTACGLYNCGGCGSHSEWFSYAYYFGCNIPNTPLCDENINLPFASAYCGAALTVQHQCGSGSYAFPVLDECGPQPGQNLWEPLCQKSELAIACLNPAAFSAVSADPRNPCQIGVLGVYVIF